MMLSGERGGEEMDNFYFLLSFIFYSMATPGTSDWEDKNGIGKGIIGIINDIKTGSRDNKSSFEFYQNTIWLLLIPFEIFTIIYFMIYAYEQFSFTLISFSLLLFGLFGYGIRRLLGLPIVVFQLLGTAFLVLSLANLISFPRFQTNVSQTAPTESGGASDTLSRAPKSLSPMNESVAQRPTVGENIDDNRPLGSEINLPHFGDYPSGNSDKLSVDITYDDPWMSDFSSRIKSGFKEKANFSKNSYISTWGCGTFCLMGVVVNKINGIVYSLPLGGEENPSLSFYSQRGSNLLLATWEATWERDVSSENVTCLFEAFVWDGKGGFAPVDGYPLGKPGSCPSDISLPD